MTGTRGPKSGSLHALPAKSPRTPIEAAQATRKVPPVPRDLGTAGKRTWRAVMAHAPLLLVELDGLAVHRLCQLADERETAAAELSSKGYLLAEPIVSPTGKVVGERAVLNPAVPALRALDKELDALSDRLGIVPAARARLGLTFTTVELQRLEVDRVLGSRWKEKST